MNWYYKLLANRPYMVLIIVAVISMACIVVALTFQKLPDFTDPTLVCDSSAHGLSLWFHNMYLYLIEIAGFRGSWHQHWTSFGRLE